MQIVFRLLCLRRSAVGAIAILFITEREKIFTFNMSHCFEDSSVVDIVELECPSSHSARSATPFQVAQSYEHTNPHQ